MNFINNMNIYIQLKNFKIKLSFPLLDTIEALKPGETSLF